VVIRNEQQFRDGSINWDCIQSAFPAKCIPGDLDGFIERKGYFLILEVKSPGTPIPKGQKWAYVSGAKSGIITTFVIWGVKENPKDINSKLVPQRMEIFSKNHIKGTGKFDADLDLLIDYCQKWWDAAENGKL
jgi:hypothetical protein